jgi:hypothetical protein
MFLKDMLFKYIAFHRGKEWIALISKEAHINIDFTDIYNRSSLVVYKFSNVLMAVDFFMEAAP